MRMRTASHPSPDLRRTRRCGHRSTERRCATVLLGLVASVACVQPELPAVRTGSTVQQECPSLQAENYFLPEDRLSYDSQADSALRTHLSTLLEGAAQVPLWCGSDPEEAYRIIWLPSFQAPLIAIISRDGSGWQGTVASYTHARALPARNPTAERPNILARAVPADEASEIVQVFAEAGLWREASLRLTDGEGSDGGTLIVEARVQASYQLIRRWQPNDEPLGRAARMLIEAAGGSVPPELMPRR
jgi:hypothetical protein